VGRRLRRLRRQRGWTQEALADRAQLSRVQVATIETDQADPRLSTLRKLARALKVSVGDLTN
jgi:transcriptional regulator with XRE-family HTH domain